jgi:hypothetical protein
VLSLRDASNPVYRKVERAIGLLAAGIAVLLYGFIAWRSPADQDEFFRGIAPVIPFITAIAIAARFGFRPGGLIGEAAFLTLGTTHLVFRFYRPEEHKSIRPLQLSGALQFVGYIAMLAFFYLAATDPNLHRTPWPGGALRMNRARWVYAAILAACLAGCGYFFHFGARQSFPAAVLSTTAFAGCLLAVFGLTTGRKFQ